MSAVYKIRCNGCKREATGASDTSLQSARRMARPHGWTNPHRGCDLCKLCSDARAEREKKENPNGYL